MDTIQILIHAHTYKLLQEASPLVLGKIALYHGEWFKILASRRPIGRNLMQSVLMCCAMLCIMATDNIRQQNIRRFFHILYIYVYIYIGRLVIIVFHGVFRCIAMFCLKHG